MTTTYHAAGVDIHLGDEASRILYEAARQTWANRAGRFGEVITPFDDFTGLRVIDIGGLPAGTVLSMGFDGVGTKVEIGERIARHDTIAFDLLAMVCDDAVVRGGEPVVVGTVLDVNCLGREGESYLAAVRQLAKGYVEAAAEAGVAVINGEVAELGVRVQGFGPFTYNWSAGVLWFARRDRMFTGFEIQPGDALVGLREKGFRSNGLSLVRQIFCRQLGENWHESSFQGSSLGELVLWPSRIYTRPVAAMLGGIQDEPRATVHGVAHITGGGIPGKLGRVLKPRRLGAHLDAPFPPGDVVLYCQELGGVPDEEAYRTWNMGQGMIIVTPEPDKAIALAEEYGVEGRVIGAVTASPGITIRSQGNCKQNKELTFI
jgi:phosphoribosylformylglycinamidine cyclo-ligase